MNWDDAMRLLEQVKAENPPTEDEYSEWGSANLWNPSPEVLAEHKARMSAAWERRKATR